MKITEKNVVHELRKRNEKDYILSLISTADL